MPSIKVHNIIVFMQWVSAAAALVWPRPDTSARWLRIADGKGIVSLQKCPLTSGACEQRRSFTSALNSSSPGPRWRPPTWCERLRTAWRPTATSTAAPTPPTTAGPGSREEGVGQGEAPPPSVLLCFNPKTTFFSFAVSKCCGYFDSWSYFLDWPCCHANSVFSDLPWF